MSKLFMWIGWCLIGAILFLAGCRIAVTAEKLEASFEIHPPLLESGKVEFINRDQNTNKPRID